MLENEKLDVFISYSHLDELFIDQFIKHTAPLKINGHINDWHDRKIVAGNEFQDSIDLNLNNADIICLFISANFLSSPACVKEIKEATILKFKKGISVIPIIVSPCGWLDMEELSGLLALPSDGQPISSFTDQNDGWKSVYDEIKVAVEEELKVKQLKSTKDFSDFLQSTDLLTKSHPEKETILLEDIFIYPELEKFDYLKEFERKESSEKLIPLFLNKSKLLIAGENQSGKTTLCKKIYSELRRLNLIPVYLSAKSNKFQGNIGSIVSTALKEQYIDIDVDSISKDRIAILLDDFHLAKNKEKHIAELQDYNQQLIVVDDIYSFNFNDEKLIQSYSHFRISELRPTLRNKLIEKWNGITDENTESLFKDNEVYKKLDRKSEVVNTTLGNIIGNGIMPSFPFFILSIISTYETFSAPLDQEITSQGYCYQAFIYIYLRKQGVKNDEIDIYINFLTEFAYYFYSRGKKELSQEEFNLFMEMYLEKFNLPLEQKKLLNDLEKSLLIKFDSFGNYSFNHRYIYYFFVAKYLAENINDNKRAIDSIIANLNKDENSYIAIFISHHSNSDYILDEIALNAYVLFDKYEPATLGKKELSFFDKKASMIVDAVLPQVGRTPETERALRLKEQDSEEQHKRDAPADTLDDDQCDTDIALELRRSIKTVEVMGRIIKNRAGSLEKSRLEFIFEEAMNVHLRILTYFFAIIENERGQESIIEFISDRIDKFVGEHDSKPSDIKLKKLSSSIFWNMNFFTVYGFIDKMVHSLGSNKLMSIVDKVCDNKDTPASFILKHGILMWYNKNLQVDVISKRISEDGFSRTAKKVVEFMIVNHCSMHHIGFKDLQKINSKFGIPSRNLLLQQGKLDS